MGIQWTMDGAWYAKEAGTMNLFFCEEALQVASLSAGTAIMQRRWDLAERIMSHALWGTWDHLFGQCLFMSMISDMWYEFLVYWVVTDLQKDYLWYKMEQLKEADARAAAEGSAEGKGKVCAANLQEAVEGGATTVEAIMEAFLEDENCQSFYNQFKRSRGLSQAKAFMDDLSQYGRTLSSADWTNVYKYFTYHIDEANQLSGTFINRNPTNTTSTGTTTTQKRETVSLFWRSFNNLQKLAYKNRPGGYKSYGYTVLFDYIWRNDTNNSESYVPPAYGFKQVGLGPESEEQQIVLIKKDTDTKLSQLPIIQDSIGFINRTSTINPIAIADIQRGTMTFLKDVPGTVVCEYMCGSNVITNEEIGKDIKAGYRHQFQHFPIRWRTLNTYAGGGQAPVLIVQTAYSLLEVRYPTNWVEGDIVTFKTFTPAEDARFIFTDETNNAVVWDEVVGSDGLIRLALTHENAPYSIKINDNNLITYWKSGVTALEATKDEYINIEEIR